MPLFEPIGAQARWRTIFEMLEPLPVQATITYAEIADRLDMDPLKERPAIQMAARRAIAELLQVHHRTCEPVRNVGYRVVEPEHHLVLAQSRDRRARNQMRQGYDVATKVDLNGLPAVVRDAMGAIALGFARQMEINNRVDAKQRRHDEAIALLQRQVAELRSKGGADA